MCPVPKAVQQTAGTATTAVSVTPGNATTGIEQAVQTTNLIHDNPNISSTVSIVESAHIESGIR